MANQLRLSGKVAIVIGCSTGIGRTIALKLADEGAKLVVCASRSEKYDGTEQATHELIREKHGIERAVFLKTDISKPDDVEAAVKEAVSRGGKLDIVVNNAALLSLARCHESSIEDWDRTININLRGTFLSCKYAITQFLTQDKNSHGVRGNIINIGSFASQVGAPWSAGYCASKGGTLNLTKNIALDYAAEGIQCNIILPGYAQTEMTKDFFSSEMILQRMQFLTPWWNAPEGSCANGVANAVAFVASDESMFMNGAAINIDGGVMTQ